MGDFIQKLIAEDAIYVSSDPEGACVSRWDLDSFIRYV